MTFLQSTYEILTEPGSPKDGPVYSTLPLAGAALPLVIISIVYILFVLKLGPMWMKNRPAFQLKRVIFLYNVAQIVANLYVCLGATYMAVSTVELDMGCFLKLHPDHRLKWLEASAAYLFYLLKIVDYMDTVFFVLRKSFRQITFLHVYHHVMMAFFVYFYGRTHGHGGHVGLVGINNSLVHAVMYTYYLLSALRTDTRQSLWWKKYITLMQIAQFVVILIQQNWPLLVRRDCEFPKIWLLLSSMQAALMLYLFINFYINNYIRKKDRKAVAEKAQ